MSLFPGSYQIPKLDPLSIKRYFALLAFGGGAAYCKPIHFKKLRGKLFSLHENCFEKFGLLTAFDLWKYKPSKDQKSLVMQLYCFKYPIDTQFVRAEWNGFRFFIPMNAVSILKSQYGEEWMKLDTNSTLYKRKSCPEEVAQDVEWSFQNQSGYDFNLLEIDTDYEAEGMPPRPKETYSLQKYDETYTFF